MKISHLLHFLFPNQGWPTQRWSGVWTGRTGCPVRTAAPRSSTKLWIYAGRRGLRRGQPLNICRTLSTTTLSPQRDNMKCNRDQRKRKCFLLVTPKGTICPARCETFMDQGCGPTKSFVNLYNGHIYIYTYYRIECKSFYVSFCL